MGLGWGREIAGILVMSPEESWEGWEGCWLPIVSMINVAFGY